MTKAGFIEAIRFAPDDAEIIAFNGDSGQMEIVTGLLLGTQRTPFKHTDGEIPSGTYIIEICTDDVS